MCDKRRTEFTLRRMVRHLEVRTKRCLRFLLKQTFERNLYHSGRNPLSCVFSSSPLGVTQTGHWGFDVEGERGSVSGRLNEKRLSKLRLTKPIIVKSLVW